MNINTLHPWHGTDFGKDAPKVVNSIIEIPKGSRILTFNYDTGERYLSIEGLF